MSLNQLAREHVSTVFMNTDHFAESCPRYINGDEGDILLITGIPGDDMVATDDIRGRGYTHSRTFDIAESTVLNVKDAVKIGELRYEVVHVSDPVLGMKTAKLARTQQEVRGGKVFRNGDI